MTLKDYLEQFRKNMMVMSRTANGRLDLSASATKADSMAAVSAEDARSLALENTDRAVRFLFDHRRQFFRSAGEVEALVLEAAEITNQGIVKDGSLFRSGEDSVKFNYARIRDIPVFWDWFIRSFHWLLTSQILQPADIAAFCEYVINIVGHFFSDGCGKISMLISTYVFMRYDLPCPEYTSRDDYYRTASRGKIPAAAELRLLPADPEFWNFVCYYRSLCKDKEPRFNSVMEQAEDRSYVCRLTGQLTGVRNILFRQIIELFYKMHGDVLVVFDCGTLAWIDQEGIRVLADLKAAGRRFLLKNPSADCTVLFLIEGLAAFLEEKNKLPQIDLSGCEKINEGANGVIYRVNDEVVAKTFKKEPDYYDLVRQRLALRNALICGVPAPFSFGYAIYEGKIVTLMELIRSRSLMQIIASEEDSDGYIIRYAQFVRQLHEIRDPKKLQKFSRDMMGREILDKADRCDSVLPEAYRGRARALIGAAGGPECLVHGDIQPNNVMISGDEMLFIDFDTFSTGKAVYDLGALCRTLLCSENRSVSDFNDFLRLPDKKCREIWDLFIRAYYQGEREEIIREKTAQARLIGTVLALAKMIKKGADPAFISYWANELKQLVSAAV